VSGVFKDERHVAVGNLGIVRVPAGTTFQDFLFAFLIHILGERWIQSERQRTSRTRSPLIDWLDELIDLRRKAAVTHAARFGTIELTGSTLTLMTLAHDMYSIYHCGANLPSRMLKRLKGPEFQSTKYEIAVAGLFARAGFTIKWITDRSRRRPEFTATHKTTGERLTVEAKSRHRPGVLTVPGIKAAGTIRADLDQLLNEALRKDADGLPYLIYLDANLPPSEASGAFPPWTADIQRMLDDHEAGIAPAKPARFAAITVTNFSWHYGVRKIATGTAESLFVIPAQSAPRIKDDGTVRLIYQAANEYGMVPKDWED
jgi:hypothetical protein